MAAVPGLYCVTYLVVGEGGIVVVDVGSRTDAPGVVEAINLLGRPRTSVCYVTPTHLHFDHALGIDALAAELDVPVALGRVAYEVVVEHRPLTALPLWPLLRAAPTWVMQGMPMVPPADLLATLDYGSPWGPNSFLAPLAPPLDESAPLPSLEGWTVLATPGHSDDSICLYHEAARFLIAGDTVRNFLGGEWNPLLASTADYQRTKDALRSLDVDFVFPGHGPIIEAKKPGRALDQLVELPPWIP